MAALDDAEGRNEDIPFEYGRVGRVCQQWLVHEDGAMAYNLQQNENQQHFHFNRSNRHTVREDIVNAKIAQHEEELREQEDALRILEDKKRIAERDEFIAKQLMEKEQEEEDHLRELQSRDEAYALELQKREQRRYERYQQKKRERELARERRRLEHQLAEQAGDLAGSTEQLAEAAGGAPAVRLRQEDGKLEDAGDFSDFYTPPPPGLSEDQVRSMQEHQDEELARLLQEQEHKRGGQVNRDKLRDIEKRDEKLAAIIQEQEKLRLAKARQRMKQMSLDDRATARRHSPPIRSVSVPESSHSGEGEYAELGAVAGAASNEHLYGDDYYENSHNLPMVSKSRSLNNDPGNRDHETRYQHDRVQPHRSLDHDHMTYDEPRFHQERSHQYKSLDHDHMTHEIEARYQQDRVPPHYQFSMDHTRQRSPKDHPEADFRPSRPGVGAGALRDDAPLTVQLPSPSTPPPPPRHNEYRMPTQPQSQSVSTHMNDSRRSTSSDDTVDSMTQVTSGPQPTFNIAAAIDPTFKRRSQHQPMPSTIERVLPPDDEEEELPEYLAAHNRRVPNSVSNEFAEYDSDDDDEDEEPVMAIQGQRRTTEKKKTRHLSPKRSSCKQQ